MAVNPINLPRVSNQLRSMFTSRSLSLVQRQLLEVQQQLATGRRVMSPSDDVGSASLIQQLRRTLEQREAYSSNLKSASSRLSEVDSTLSSLESLLRDAQSIASATIGSTLTAEERDAQATLIDSIYRQVLSLSNKQVGGLYVFGGDRGTGDPFTSVNGGVKWNGSTRQLFAQVDPATRLQFTVSGASVFGALSSRVRGREALTPALTDSTRLVDLRGVTNDGVRPGVIRIDNGSGFVDIDLSDADNVGDIIDRINAAGLGGVTAQIDSAGTGIEILAGAGDNLTIVDQGGGSLARDLGIERISPAGAGVDIAGGAVRPKVSALTQLADLRGGAGIDLSGLTITNGLTTSTIDLTGVSTVEDLLNRINNAPAGVFAQINPNGDGIDILNPIQGVNMSITEAGGTTAADLGVRSFDVATKISDLNLGVGLPTIDGPELRITDSAGVSFDVELEGLDTVQDLIDAINAAATSAGAGVTAGFSSTSNGLTLTDTAAGAGTISVQDIGLSGAAARMGLTSAAVGNVITGTDVAPVASTGVFASLLALANAMRDDDQSGMTKAAERLAADLQNIIRVHGETGARLQEIENRLGALDEQNLVTAQLLSDIEDVDYAEAISRFQTLQTTMQASLQTASTTLNLSLMDFLR